MIQLLLVIISFVIYYCMSLSWLAIGTLQPGINPLAVNNDKIMNNTNFLGLFAASCHSDDI